MSGVSPSARPDQTPFPAPRIHRMRVARGACWVIVAGAGVAAALILLDATVRLPGWVRGFGLAVWVTSTGVLAWRFVLRPWSGERPADARLSPRQELPGNLRAAAAAALALVGCLLAGTFVPGASEHLRRFAFPWQKNMVTGSRVVVTSGDPVVRRGDAVSLTAYVEKPVPGAAATFVWHDPVKNRETRLAVAPDASGTFHLRRTGVVGGFRYRVEAGEDASDWFTVTVLDPVLLIEGTTTTVRAPRYAPQSPARVLPGFPDLDSLGNGTAEFRFVLDRPAGEAFLEFRTAAGALEVTRVALDAEGRTGTATFFFRQPGSLRLVLVNEEHGKRLRTEIAVAVRVRADEPPRFTRVSGIVPRPVTARPNAVLRIACGVADDVAVGEAALEYVLDSFDSRSEMVPIPLTGAGTPTAHGVCVFPLAGKGGTVQFRLRVSDTRRSAEIGLSPQVAYYPASGWATVKIDPAAPPIEDQEAVARRDVVRASLDEATQELRTALEAVELVQSESDERAALAPEHAVRLNNAREGARAAAGHLHAAADEAALNPELRALAALARVAADRFVHAADDPLRRAATDAPVARGTTIATAARHLGDAIDRAEQLLARNDRTARDRIDARMLAAFAAEQAQLAEQCTTLPAAEVAARQRDLLTRLERLIAESDPLRSATDASKQTQFDRLSGVASDLAGAVRDWNTAAQRLHAEVRERLLGAAVEEQRALAAQMAALLDRTETAARLANVSFPRLGAFRAVSDLTAGGKLLDAMREMVLLANTLDSVADTFEKWSVERGDPRAAAKQLAVWQDDLRARFRAATGGNSAMFAALPEVTRTAFRAEQAAVRETVAALSLPPGEKPRAARAEALKQLSLTGDFLAGTGANADRAMELSARELGQLAAQVPTVAERLARTRTEFMTLWREQAQVLAAAELAMRNAPDTTALTRRLVPIHDQQRRVLAAFQSLDLPGMSARRTRVVAALIAAAADLRDASALDVPASQRWVQAEFERIKNLLSDGVVPPDDRADELASRAAAVERAVAALGPRASVVQLQVSAEEFQKLVQLVNQLPASPEAAALLGEAREAVQMADLGFRNGSKPEEVLRRVAVAGRALAGLADRFTGTESEVDRVRRLVAYRRAGAAAAERHRTANLPPDPTLAAEIVRQLGREVDELVHIRAGSAGQNAKRRVLDQYGQLRKHATPERAAGLHAALAESLDELAALMADIDELTLTFHRKPPAVETGPADEFLPSRASAEALRVVSRGYRALQVQLTHLPEEIVRRTKPGDPAALSAIELRQRALLADVAKFAEGLAPHSAALPIDAGQTADLARQVAERLHDGGLFAAQEAADRLVTVLRSLARVEIAAAATRLADRQVQVRKEIGTLLGVPNIATAQQRLRGAELVTRTAGFARALEQHARDAGGPAGALTEAATATTAAGRALSDAGVRADAGKAEDAAQLRGAAESHLRAAAGMIAGAGSPATTLPALDPEAVATGDTLRRAERAMRGAARDLDGKANPVAAAKAMLVASEALRAIAKDANERLTSGEIR